jgi:prevent-host-death family protein
MDEVPLRDFRAKMTELLGPVIYANERIALLNHGKRVAVLMSNKDYDSMVTIVREFDRMRELKEEEKEEHERESS